MTIVRRQSQPSPNRPLYWHSFGVGCERKRKEKRREEKRREEEERGGKQEREGRGRQEEKTRTKQEFKLWFWTLRRSRNFGCALRNCGKLFHENQLQRMDLVAWEPNMDSEIIINITRTIYVTFAAFAVDTSFGASAIAWYQ